MDASEEEIFDCSEEDISEVDIFEDGIGKYFYLIALGNKCSITFIMLLLSRKVTFLKFHL